MKAAAHLNVNLSGFCKVGSAESVGAVQQESPVSQIHGLQRNRPGFAEALAERNIERRMTRQMTRAVAIEKARTVANVPGYETV